jgi:hypothetical protein
MGARSDSGTPWVGLLAILVIVWLIFGGIFLGFLFPAFFGVVLLLAARLILVGSD